jgi:hypothetical protein
MAASNLHGLSLQSSYPPNQDMSFEALVIQPMLSSLTQSPLNAPSPHQAFNSHEQWLINYLFTEGSDDGLNMPGLDEWPNDDELLVPNQVPAMEFPIQTRGMALVSLESMEQTMGRLSLNERLGQSSI